MAPRPAAICGTSAPTAKNRVATAMPIWPVRASRAMIDQVMLAPDELRLNCCRVEAALPRPACGERVGVRGTLQERSRGESPSPDRCAIDLSPQAGRGEKCPRLD